MEKAKAFLECNEEVAEAVGRLTVPLNRSLNDKPSFYDAFAIRGIRVDRVEPGFISCSFKVPPRLVDRDGKLASGAIANLVDAIGATVVHVEGIVRKISVDMSISYLAIAKVDDELEIISRALGQRDGYFGASVLLKNKATGEIIAEGRHSLLCKYASKI